MFSYAMCVYQQTYRISPECPPISNENIWIFPFIFKYTDSIVVNFVLDTT